MQAYENEHSVKDAEEKYTWTMNPSQQSYRPPRRKPAHETLERILTAAEEQLREQDLDAFTIQSVLQRTGLSVGAFYSRFPDKTALLHELQHRVHRRVDASILDDLAKETEVVGSLSEAVDRGFGLLIQHVLSERQLFRAFMMLSVFDSEMRQIGEQVNSKRKEAIAELLAPYRDEIGHPDPDVALDTAYAFYSNVMRGRLVYYAADDMQFGVTDQTLFEGLRHSLTLFLHGSNAETGGASARNTEKKGGER